MGGIRALLLMQLVGIVEKFIHSDHLHILPQSFNRHKIARDLVIDFNMPKIVRHLRDAIRQENSERLEPVFDNVKPIGTTADMYTWYTAKPNQRTVRSHINVCVFDSSWEASDAFALENSEHVTSWVKNDHLGFEIFYSYLGGIRRYRPDFLVRLNNGINLILETKGQVTDQDQAKQKALQEWVQAVTEHGGFGKWCAHMVTEPHEINEVLAELADNAAHTSTINGASTTSNQQFTP